MNFIKSLFGKKKSGSFRDSSQSELSKPQPHYTKRKLEEELKHVFLKFDANKDGKISFEELRAIMASLGHEPMNDREVEAMMREADLDGDGFIDLQEFIALNTKNVDEKVIAEDLRHAFSTFDLDRNGLISPEELHSVLRSLGEEMSIAQCRKMVQGVDRNGDGAVSFEEFKIMMMGPSSGTAAE